MLWFEKNAVMCARMWSAMESTPYSMPFCNLFNRGGVQLPSFIGNNEKNIDWKTVQSFGEEWLRFENFSKEEIEGAGAEYFDIVTEKMLHSEARVLDVGCGTGRWSKYLAPRVGFIEAIDPSDAVFSAVKLLRESPNVRVAQAGVGNIPFADESFHFVLSLGVLHHLPDTQKAIDECTKKIKPGGWFLLYLYYSLDNRGHFFRFVFYWVCALRTLISSLPAKKKQSICDFIALFVYWPLARTCALLSFLGGESLAEKLPLYYYRKKSFYIMRNDSLDRFGTPLEKRFSRLEINEMLAKAGLENITFSSKAPYWHVVAQKPVAISS